MALRSLSIINRGQKREVFMLLTFALTVVDVLEAVLAPVEAITVVVALVVAVTMKPT
jgi:hypothetical protein